MLNKFRLLAALLSLTVAGVSRLCAADTPSVSKVRDVVIYEDARFHSAFPSVIQRPDGELIAGTILEIK